MQSVRFNYTCINMKNFHTIHCVLCGAYCNYCLRFGYKAPLSVATNE